MRTDQYGGFPFTPGARGMMKGHGVIMDRSLDLLLLLKRSLAERRGVVVVLHLTC